jgi:hypothetical protein
MCIVRPVVLTLAFGVNIAVVGAARPAVAQQPLSSDVTVAEAASDRGLGLTIFTASFLAGDATTSVLVGVEVRGVAETALIENGRPRQLEIAYVATSGLSTSVERAVAVPLADTATVRTAARDGARVLTRMTLPTGQYALRVNVRDSGDQRTASTVHDLVVPNLLEASFTMSGLVLSASAVGGVTHAGGEEDIRLLPLVAQPPTGRRLFSRRERLEVNAQIYQSPPESADADFDQQLRVTTILEAPDGRVVYEATDFGTSETLTSGAYGYHHYALVPIATVPPGPYAVRVSASVNGVTTTSRSVPIAIADR